MTGRRRTCPPRLRQSLEDPDGLPIEIAERFGLKAVGHQAKEKVPGEMGRREPAPMIPPAQPQVLER